MGDEGGEVAIGLTELQRAMKDLDPSMIDFTKKGFFGRVANPIRTYFDQYQKADNVINDNHGILWKKVRYNLKK